jgi:hypothetical protein
MLNQYKNIDQIQVAATSVSAERIEDRKLQFASYDANESVYFNTEITTQTDDSRLELHVYSDDTWITGNHKVTLKNKIPSYIDVTTKETIKFPAQPVAINLYDELSNLNLTAGNFRIAVNFFKNLVGNYERQHLRIDEISPDRTELRLRAIDGDDPEFLKQITNYIRTVKQTSAKFYKSYLLNFSRNQCVLFVNSVVIGEYLYVKLYEPLPAEYDVDLKCWVVEEQKPAYIDRISIRPFVVEKTFNRLANPNWYANASYNISSETGLKTWNDLLGSSVQTSQQIIDAYFSGSLSGIDLNINFSDFNNFIFYSSATERLSNFRYKLELLEYYASQSSAISQLSGSVATTNAAEYQTNKTNLISGFDAFEKFLYYQSSSKLTTYDITLENANVPTVTGSYITPVPKSNPTRPYTLYPVSSSQFQTWFSTTYEYAKSYDDRNYNSLIKAIPEFIRFDSNNENLATFVNMLAHHYDILYTYINHMTKIHKREENPKLGMPNELLYSVAKQFGWNLTDGNQYQDLWQYVLGTSETGVPLTGSNTVGDPSVPGREMTYTVWRRIVNNLPLLLKSKGTKRSVQALLSCYGIPQSMITIKEYGGPRLERAPVYEKLNFDYALDLSGSAAGTVVTAYSQSINSVELRFRTADVTKYPTIPNTMNLFNIGSNSVTLDFVSGNKGTININGTGSAAIEMFDGGWLTALLRTSQNKLEVVAKKAKYGKIVTAASASATASFAYSASVTLGGTSTGASRLVGQLQELRLWSSSLNDTAFNNHVKAPSAYNGNTDAYSELVYRLPLTQKINHALTSSLPGVQPISSAITSSFAGWTLNTPYDSIEETYYFDAPSLAAGTYDDNKIRLEDNELVGTLDFKTRAERSQFDKAPLDSKKLGVYFSPQTMIDEDIIAHFGFLELDDYIGDPGETESESYPRLIQKAQDYWKKYTDRNDINAYIKIFTLFDLSFFRQLEQLLPARTSKLTGILVQPNILERSKSTVLPKIERFDNSYDTTLGGVSPTASGDYLNYLGEIDGKVLTISAEDDDQWIAYLTASNAQRYGGTTYSYPYLVQSGSTYITASTPYWMSEAVLPVILDAVTSEFRYKSGSFEITQSGWSGPLYGSGVYGTSMYSTPLYSTTGSYARVQDFLPIGLANHRFNGAKMTSPAFNVNSTQTVDGKPVVEWRETNPNQLIYQTNGDQGSFVLA